MKFLSRKLLVLILTGILNMLVLTGTIHTAGNDLILQLFDGLAAVYVIIQGIIDAIHGKQF